MPELSFFLDQHDLGLLLERLNADSEIAFIVAGEGEAYRPRSSNFTVQFTAGELTGMMEHPRHWKAVQTVDALADGLHSLWHIPAGPLPLIDVKRDTAPIRLMSPQNPTRHPSIRDPWSGWVGTDQFGPGCSPWIRLEVWTRHHPYTQHERTVLNQLNAFWMNRYDMFVVSGFQWTGSHFRPAPPQTQRWWNHMKSWVNRNAVRLRSDPGFWAFPSALRKLKSGMQYYSRNFDLDEAIRRAGSRDWR